MFDVTIVGAGVIGCSIARELSRYKLKVCVIDKDSDVANGTTKANSAIVHAGFDAKPATLKGKLNAKGNAMFDKLAEELDFPFKRIGSLVLCFDKDDLGKLNDLKEQGDKNGVPGLEIIEGDKLREKEPNISDEVVAAMHAPTGGIVCPYEMTIALAENAFTNGVDFKFETKLETINKVDNMYVLKTNKGNIETNIVINAAGVFADEINNMVSNNKLTIVPRKGEYCLFDKSVGNMISKTVFQLPTKMGKGILVTPTVDGNLLVGPNAVDIEDKNDLDTSAEGLNDVLNKAGLSIKQVPTRQVITSFSGLRAHSVENDFRIGEAKDAENFINAAGIESPGLSSAPAIAEMVVNIIVEKLSPSKNEGFNPIRKGIPKFREMNNEERNKLIQQDSRYGKIICRCETVTEGEIINAIKRPLGARTLDGVKRRTRSGMGRCQSGFCAPRIVEILSRELNILPTEVTKFGGKSQLLVGKDKETI
ncbi:NAD(P)/FAD-dependent oxidoreductase [Clostridium sp. PL3]|uniref:NAD(P)/FAD-dependent oxidoreductase n=1 Tax=Clostridium thailandense TaxID=2794346 RepID=A0A949X531_9CLOT|nr:NAD(P)/FAD-dependent oxidoreductase [Clostridium thailandense]MBV7274968.1 NAD(P)/FAD-dependent oxidoreductase [Clostridium thailandense]